MKNITYIIIFILVIALGLLYTQLVNYQNIIDNLLYENNQQTETITILNNDKLELNNNIENLHTKITTLENNLSHELNTSNNLKNTIEEQNKNLLEHNITIKVEDINYTIPTNDLNISLEPVPQIVESNDTTTAIEQLDVKPNITLDDENKITGFGLEYQQTF